MHPAFAEFQLNEYENNHFTQMFSEECVEKVPSNVEAPHRFIHNGSVYSFLINLMVYNRDA